MGELGPCLYLVRDDIGYLIPPFPANQQKVFRGFEVLGP